MSAGSLLSKQFIQMTSGWIPVSVMVLLAIALIAGQASANLPQATRVDRQSSGPVAVEISLDAANFSTRMHGSLESLPAAMQTFLAWPAEFELSIDEINFDASSGDTQTLQKEVADEATLRIWPR